MAICLSLCQAANLISIFSLNRCRHAKCRSSCAAQGKLAQPSPAQGKGQNPVDELHDKPLIDKHDSVQQLLSAEPACNSASSIGTLAWRSSIFCWTNSSFGTMRNGAPSYFSCMVATCRKYNVNFCQHIKPNNALQSLRSIPCLHLLVRQTRQIWTP